MNTNNLSWVDNKVLNASAQNKPYQNTMPAQYQNTPPAPAQTGVSPATYQSPMANTPNQTGLSPATFQAPMGNTPSQMGVSPEQYQAPMAKQPTQMGVSPAQYQDDMSAGVSMPVRQSPAMQGTLTRDEAYDSSPFSVQGPPTVMSPGYLPAYLKTIIGKRIRAEFVFQNLYLDKTGILREVGVNYFVLEDNATHAMIMCDLYSARFVTSA